MTAKNDERCVLQSDSAVLFEYKLWYNTRVKRLFENQFCLRERKIWLFVPERHK